MKILNIHRQSMLFV